MPNMELKQHPNLSIAKLALANGLSISAAVISVTASALVAKRIGWQGGFATIPYGLQFLSLLLATFVSARFMQRLGRKPVFLIAAMFGAIGGALGFASVQLQSPALLCLAHIALGIQLANGNFYRFAVLDLATPARKAQAMSLVVAGGTFAALIGPYLSRQAVFAADVFASAYIGISVLSAVIAGLIVTTPLPQGIVPKSAVPRFDFQKALRSFPVLIGMTVAAFGYGVMNLLMIAAALSLDAMGCGFAQISWAIQWHVLAMFLPSLVMGRIVAKIGGMAVALLGVIIIVAGATLAWRDPLNIPLIEITLVLLGLGWNMTYVAGSYLVASHARQDDALAIQASHDIAVGVFAMLGAFLPGPMLAGIGWGGTNLAVAIMMLGLAGAISIMRLIVNARKISTSSPAYPS